MIDSKTFITEPARQLPLSGTYDVIVAGGGPSGFAAALRAAREGCRVLLLEKNECLGGIWTSGLMPWIIDTPGKSGILVELCNALTERGGYQARPNTFTAPPEELRHLLEKLCLESGVTIRYGTWAADAITEKNVLKFVITESKSGREAWQGKIFIDATGDGDLAARAGCAFDYGNESGIAQPASLTAILGGVDPEIKADFFVTGDGKKKLLAAMNSVGIDPSYAHPSLFHYGCGIVGLMSHHAYGVDPLDADSRTQAVLTGRAELHKQINALRTLPGWEKTVLLGTAANLGIREGRRIKGRACVTTELLRSDYPANTVCIPKFCIDIHSPDPSKCKSVVQDRPQNRAAGYGIPFAAMVTQDVENLLVTGRCISGDFYMHASYRVTGNSVPLGEAAGFGAAQAVQKNIQLFDVDNVPCFSKQQ